MSYVQKTLLPGENILYSTKPHYAIFLKVLMWPLLAAVMLQFGHYNAFLGGILLLVGLYSFVTVLVGYLCSEYVVTTKRVIMKSGFIRRQSLELFLDKLEGIYVEQGIVGRMLNFGTVIIVGIGSTKNYFFYTPNPLEFRANVQVVMQR